MGIQVTKAPEGRHVTFAQITDEADSYIKPSRLEHLAPEGLKKLTQTFIMHIAPRWGFKTFGHCVCYKHAAPLGLKKLTQTFIMHIASRCG